MDFLKQIYKYSVIVIGGSIFLFSLFMTLNMDFMSKAGKGVYTDGFGNKQNPENGKAYWNMTYLGERAVQIASFFGGIVLVSYGLEIKKKENGTE